MPNHKYKLCQTVNDGLKALFHWFLLCFVERISSHDEEKIKEILTKI